MRQRRAVFLDRDGVLNELVERDGGRFSPRRFDQFKLFPWCVGALTDLSNSGLFLVVVTNQPDIARGLLELAELSAMHELLHASTPVNKIYTCPHETRDNCLCRKPQPGLLLNAAQEFHLDLSQSWIIGDRLSDLEAGRRAGTRLAHVATGQDPTPIDTDVLSFVDLRQAADHIISLI